MAAHATSLREAVSPLWKPSVDASPPWLTPRWIFSVSGRLVPWLAVIGVVLSMSGLLIGLMDDSVPATSQAAKIGLIYLPAAWLATLLLLFVAFWSLLGLVCMRSLCFMVAQALAPTGGMFAFLALWSGAIWSKAVNGDWWTGSAREFAEVMLLGVYVAIIAVPTLIDDVDRADRWAAVLAMFGASQVPFLYFLVDWVMTLIGTPHGLTLMKMAGGPALLPMLLVAVGLWLHATLTGLVRLRCMIVERDIGL